MPLPAYSGDNSGLERSSSFTATTKQWSIFGLPEHPETPLSCISSALYFLVRPPTIIQSSSTILLALITQSLIPYLVYRSRRSAASPRQQMWNQLLFPSQHCPSGTSTSLPTVPGNRQFHPPFIPSRNSKILRLLRLQGMASFPATETTLWFFAAYMPTKSALKPSSSTWQVSASLTLRTACQTPSRKHHFFISSCGESSAQWASLHISAFHYHVPPSAD